VVRAESGLGLFATRPIEQGTALAKYWGRRIRTAEAETLRTKYLFKLNSRWTIDGSNKRNVARFINHSCKPNAEAYIVRNSSIVIRAIKNIAAGEEITYHYGEEYFDALIKLRGCRCRHCNRNRR
jgi:SET domain-containing protein